MSYCKFCGKEIGEAKFCPDCGKQQIAEQPRTDRGRRLHCPHCRSVQLTAVVESNTTTGTAVHSRVTKRTGVTSYSARTTSRHYWMCRECGHKFRNLENLNTELEATKKSYKALTIFSILLGLCCLWILSSLIAEPGALLLFGLPMVLVLGLEVFLVVGTFIDKKSIERMTADKAYLEQHCFD